MKKFGLLFLILFLVSQLVWGQVNITPIRTDVAGFTDWTDVNVVGTTYLQLLVADASTTTPAMNFDNYTSETLDFKARTYGGTNTTENTITISVSTDNGSTWSVITTVLPANSTMTAQTQIDLSSYSGTQVKIKFSVGGTSNSIGAGIDDITINGLTGPVSSLLLEENFDYSTGNLTSVSSSKWQNFSGIGDFIQVTNGSLSYTGYPSSGTGNKIDIISTSSSAEDVYSQFTTQVVGRKVYASFLLNLPNINGLAANTSPTGDYFVAFLPSTNTTDYSSRVSIRLGTQTDTYQIGLRASSSNSEAVWSSTNLDINTSYLIVLSYDIITGSSNNVASIWINPILTGPEPSADLTQTAGTDITEVSRIAIRQGTTTTPNASIDGIRVATEWSQAPLPVELSSFSASVVGNAVKLNWKTETEVNNYGFDVERTSNVKGQTSDGWEKVGFVNGNGNSNSPKSYSFTDTDVLSGKYSYRLKQIDNDGQFEYSKTIEVDLGAPSKFELAQNFPNPFNPVTAIRFTLPVAGSVKLTVYNLLGQEVQSLVNEYKEAGTHIINFNASEFNSGVYIYKLEANGVTQTRKMTLIK